MADISIDLKYNEIDIENIGIVFDSHIHIQSSHTTPLPLLWHVKLPDTPVPFLKRFLVNRIAPFITDKQGGGTIVGAFFGKAGYLMFQEHIIGAIVASKNLICFHQYEKTTYESDYNRIFSPMIVMPMDMEYAHISGFEEFGGHTIYHEGKAWYYYQRKNIYKDGVLNGRYNQKVNVMEEEGKKIKLKGLISEESEKKKKPLETRIKTFKREYIDIKGDYSILNKENRLVEENSERVKYFKEKRSKERLLYNNTKASVEMSEIFVKWHNQIDRTMKAAFENPFHLIPMYHYDPRRWNGKKNLKILDPTLTHGPWHYPFKEKLIATEADGAKPEKTIFAGIKMYPPLGYKPLDPRFGYKIKEFYNMCDEKKVPILAHCSPGGIVTHDSRKYYDLDHKVDDDYSFYEFEHSGGENKEIYQALDKEEERIFNLLHSPVLGYEHIDIQALSTRLSQITAEKKKLRNIERDCYFFHEYVHPKNWEKVIKTYKNINMCMAHFGGDEWLKSYTSDPTKYGLKSDWIKEIINLISTYKNAYTDISCFKLELPIENQEDAKNVYKKIKVKGKILFKHLFKNFLIGAISEKTEILDQILFGTDWYLTLNSYKETDYQPFIEEMKVFLDSISKGLWIKFSMVNPYYFYGFDHTKKIENMYTGLKGKCSEKNMKLLEDRKSFLLGLSDKGKDGKNKIQVCKDLADKYLEESKAEFIKSTSK